MYITNHRPVINTQCTDYVTAIKIKCTDYGILTAININCTDYVYY